MATVTENKQNTAMSFIVLGGILGPKTGILGCSTAEMKV